jgi:PBP1b-binding outer membrane lipoprotein LpoB
MENLVLKIICTAIILVLFAASCHDPAKDNNMNDAYEQPVTTPNMQNDKHENSNYGMRDKVEERMDSSANSKSYNDSNPK